MPEESDRELYLKSHYKDDYEKERLRLIQSDRDFIKYMNKKIRQDKRQLYMDELTLQDIKKKQKELHPRRKSVK